MYVIKLIKYVFIAAALSFALSSCKSLGEPKSVYERLNYTEKDVYENEKKRIADLVKTEPVNALWHAELLGDADTISLCRTAVAQKYDEAMEAKNYLSALKYYRSLSAVGAASVLSGSPSESELSALCASGVPGLSLDESCLPKTIADCIDATVTVWIDRGISIKDGAGYADRVIGSGFFISKNGSK